jgi:hypothetical protein
LHLHPGVERAEAERLIATLTAAQRAVASGQAWFHLSAGAPAAYRENAVGAREHFLALDWRDLRVIAPLDAGIAYSRGYRLSVVPAKPGNLYWEVRIVLSASGDIERIDMAYGPLPPF